MEDRWEKIQVGLHLLLFSTALYTALAVNGLWTGGLEPFGLSGLNRLGLIGAGLFQIAARLLLLATPGRAWGFAALVADLIAFRFPVLHVAATLLSLPQLRLLARWLDRPDLTRWVRRMGLLLLTGGLTVAFLPWFGAIALGLAIVRYLRLVYCLADQAGVELRSLR